MSDLLAFGFSTALVDPSLSPFTFVASNKEAEYDRRTFGRLRMPVVTGVL